MQPIVIAIDGLTASGKGTLSKKLAHALGYAYLDTGLLYRATARKHLIEGLSPAKAAQSLTGSDLNQGLALRTEEVARTASKVAALPEVRQALLAYQRDFAQGLIQNEPESPSLSHPQEQSICMVGAILDGRDIGTFVWPQAQAKLFVTASSEIRAERRYKELLAKGEEAIKLRVLADLKQRDARDQGRDTAPTRVAEDALVLDTSDLNADQVFEKALAFIEEKLAS